jgi:radical SAM protein with 4Fe4S-binding SPASM domain
VAGALAGVTGYLVEAKAAIRNLIDAGIPISVNAVVTRLNVLHLDQLVSELIHWEVPRLVISPYSLPYPLRPSAARLMPECRPLHPLVEKLNQKFGGRIAIEVGSAETPQDGSSCGEKMLCEVGLRTLDVLPDGRVSRCRYMWYEPDLAVGDLKKESLLEIWTGSRLQARYAPHKELYEGTACSSCGSFSGCNQRGRCFLSAKMNNDRLFAPDSHCKAQQ